MQQTAFQFATYPANPFKYGTKTHKFYEALKRGVTNRQIVSELNMLVSHNRRTEVRRYLRGTGYYLPDGEPLGGGLMFWQIKREVFGRKREIS